MAKKEIPAATRAGGSERRFIPKENKSDDTQYVAVNGVRALLKKGEEIYVSAPFAEVLDNSRRQAQAAEKYIADNISD